MLDCSGNRSVTLNDLMGVMEHSHLFGVDLSMDTKLSTQDMLFKLAGYMLTQDISAKQVFISFDSSGRGMLDEAGLARMFQVLVPALSGVEMAEAVAQWRALNFQEVQKSMQWVTIRRAKALKRLSQGNNSTSLGQDGARIPPVSPWLGDGNGEGGEGSPARRPPHKNRSVPMLPKQEDLPQGRDLPLIKALQEHLDEHKKDFESFFVFFDTQGVGSLTASQTEMMLSTLMFGINEKKLRYFQVMINRGVSDNISFEDFFQCVDDAKVLDVELRGRSKLVLKDVLFKFAAYIVATGKLVDEVLTLYDRSGLGALKDIDDVSRFLIMLFPALRDDELVSISAKWIVMVEDEEESQLSFKWVSARAAKAISRMSNDL